MRGPWHRAITNHCRPDGADVKAGSMNRWKYAAAVLAAVLIPSAWAADDPLLRDSRSLTDTFASRLIQELQSALAEGGPLLAVEVCKDVAPQIASELSRSSGAKVSRTSSRYRNPANAPEPWQQSVLDAFSQEMTTKTGSQQPEFFAPADAETPARYARAIPTGAMCLACHGKDVPDEVARILDAEYPFDRAIGYELGDLRGAFSVSWPDSEAPE